MIYGNYEHVSYILVHYIYISLYYNFYIILLDSEQILMNVLVLQLCVFIF